MKDKNTSSGRTEKTSLATQVVGSYEKFNVRINITLSGLYAKWAREIKELGLATSNHDLVNQAIRALYTNLTEERLKIARLKALEKAGEG